MNYYIFTCFLLIIKNASCFQLNMNAPKITPWNSLQFSLKERARSLFINNAVKTPNEVNSIDNILFNPLDLIELYM